MNGRVIIIGAGLGGLAAASGLARAGFDVRIYERSQAMGEIGAGIMLTPNALRALKVVGALPFVEPMGTRPTMSYSRHFRTGELIGSRPVAQAYEADYGMAMINIHRADFHRALADAFTAIVPNGISLGHEFSRVTTTAGQVQAHFTNGDVVEGDILIGADGIRSTVRTSLGLASPPRFTGLVAWRGLVPVALLPERLRGDSMSSWIGDDRHIIEYTVGSLKNYVAIAQQDEWRSESWTNPSTLEELLSVFPDWHEDVSTILKATPPGAIFKWALFDRDPLETWSHGPVTLLGDAAHPMLPLMAQGSAMAVEDAAILTRSVTEYGATEEALGRYASARKERASWTQLQSRTARDYYRSAEASDWQNQTQKRADMLYAYDVSQTPV